MTYVPMQQLTIARFTELLYSRFRVHVSQSTAVELELVEATSVHASDQRSSDDPTSENFSLIFNGPAERPLPQQTYLFEHAKIGAFDLFIVPIGREQGSRRYQAIFNRSVPPKLTRLLPD